jgi:hypothetical protein
MYYIKTLFAQQPVLLWQHVISHCQSYEYLGSKGDSLEESHLGTIVCGKAHGFSSAKAFGTG